MLTQEEIAQAETCEQLQEQFRALHSVAAALLQETQHASDILPVLSTLHLAIMQRVYHLTAIQYQQDTGIPIANIPHAFMIMGSVARKESHLDPDQDTGLIYPDSLAEEDINHLATFAQRYTDQLAATGYTPCIGGIMASKPDMQNTLSGWKERITDYVQNPGEQGVRWSSIIFDLALLTGDNHLVTELRNHIVHTVSRKPVFLLHMLHDDARLKIPVGIFGTLHTEKSGDHKGEINLKRSALAFIVDVTRSISLYQKNSTLNTIERLHELEKTRVLATKTVQTILTAYESITRLLLTHQIEAASKGEPVHKYIRPDTLPLAEQRRLKSALQQIRKFLNNGIRYLSGSPF